MTSQAGRSQGGKSAKLSEMSREKLLDIQKREQLKGLLINKFKLKYGNKPNVAGYIDNEVNKFLKNDRLTEENLKKLDDKINKESKIREKQEAILDDRKSQKGGLDVGKQNKRPSTSGSVRSGYQGHKNPADDKFDRQSMKSNAQSIMSGASKVSK